MTRGEADTMQVRDKRTDEWKPYRELVPTDKKLARTFANEGVGFASEFSPAGQRAVANKADAPIPDVDAIQEPETAAPTAQSPNLPPEVILAALPKMNRGDLEKVAQGLGAPDVSDAKFPNADALRDWITQALQAPEA